MNAIDKIISYISPQRALKRQAARRALQFFDTGYSESGASLRKKSMRGWQAWSSSPQADIDMNVDVLRQRSRDLFMGSALGRSAIVTPRSHVIGVGLKLRSRIDAEFLGISREEADKWEKNVERQFNAWAESKFCDATRLNNFYEMQSLLFMSFLLNGDGWALLKTVEPKPYFPFSLRIHLIEADRVSSPQQYRSIFGTNTIQINPDNGNKIINGVEIDDEGAVVAYWISNKYQNDPANPLEIMEWQRIDAFSEATGRPNVLCVMEPERC